MENQPIKYHLIARTQLSGPYETSHQSYMKQNHLLNPNKYVDKISQPRSINISGCVRNHEVQLQGASPSPSPGHLIYSLFSSQLYVEQSISKGIFSILRMATHSSVQLEIVSQPLISSSKLLLTQISILSSLFSVTSHLHSLLRIERIFLFWL